MSYLNGYTENYEYDNNNNVTKLWKKTSSTASTILSYEWVYNAAGLLYKEYDYELNRTTHYEYDADGGLLRTYTIDANGKNILQIEYPQKGSVDSSVRYIIDGVILDELDVTADEENNTTTLTSHAGIVTTTSDDLGRVIGSILQTTNDFALMESYSYLNVVMTPGKADTSSSTYVSTLTMADGTVYGYSYDSIGNITRVTENGVLKLSYQYDGQGQLIREDNAYASATYAFTYDGYGNILTKSEYGYTAPDTELPTTAVSTNTYSYGDTDWPDLLKEYNDVPISYDEIGNPLSYYNGQNFTFTWEGRTLVGATDGTNTYAYTYNSNGIRVEKVANSVVHKYTVDRTKILAETYGDTALNFYYDENNSPIAFSVNDMIYYYGKNLQGDVVKIYTASGEVVAEYAYDAWGKLLAITDANGNIITDSASPAVVNPIRYRGYYYDVETGFYYLNSRYYDAGTGRFLNSDDLAFLGVSGTVLGYNLYGYCENEPVKNIDPVGNRLTNAKILLHYESNKRVVRNHKVFKIGCVIEKQSNNNLVNNMIMGKHYGDYNGCGWIATYNALCRLNRAVNPADIIYEFENKGLVCNGTFGVNPSAVKKYFSNSMFSLKKVSTYKNLEKYIKNYKVAIIWARNKKSLTFHYFTMYWNATGQFYCFDNAGSLLFLYKVKDIAKYFNMVYAYLIKNK